MRVLITGFIDKRLFIYLKCFLLLSACIFLFTNQAKAQAPGLLEFTGRALKDGKPLAGAVVTVYRDGTIRQDEIKTGKNGKFTFFLAFGSDYKMTFSYPGCIDMYLMVYTGKLPKERIKLPKEVRDMEPAYAIDVPFFEVTNNNVRLNKYKNPFTKIIYDGKKAFMDDEAYLAEFTKDVLIDPIEQARLFAEKLAKEKAEKEKLEAAEKAKKNAEEKEKKETAERLLAEQKAKEDALAKEAELARLKEEMAKQKPAESQSMETDAIRLQREKEAKALLAKKNKEIKTNYENDLLKMVAENERMAKEKAFNLQKQEARANTVIEQMRREMELKAQSNILKEEIKLKKKKELENKQYKMNEMRKLVEAANFAERAVRIDNQKALPNVESYTHQEIPNVAVTVEEGTVKTVRTTVVTQGKKLDVYKKETYFWGSVSFYKNNIEIDELTYNAEISFFSGYQNK